MVSESMADIHFGSFASSPSLGRPIHCRTARNNSSRPSTILMTPPIGLGSSGSACGMMDDRAVKTTIATMMPTSHPNKNPTLVLRARDDIRRRMTAMMGTGLIAIPSA